MTYGRCGICGGKDDCRCFTRVAQFLDWLMQKLRRTQ